MGLQTINLGTAGTQSGDTVRQSFSKCNTNFSGHESRISTLEAAGGLSSPLSDGKGAKIVKLDVDEGSGLLRLETDKGVVWAIDGLFTL